MANPLSRLVNPHYPAAAIGLERGVASVVQLERGRGREANLRRAASVNPSESLIRPSFEESNISDLSEVASTLHELAASAGLLKQKRWSAALPEATVRTTIVTLESPAASSGELDDILSWKIERGFGASMAELTVSRDRLPADAHGRARYLVSAARTAILAEYESVFHSLGWRVGLLVPRHMGEARWLTSNGFAGDSLLLSSTRDGFTAVVYRGNQPLVLRSISCEDDEREDEFFRVLLFYRDRRAVEGEGSLARLLVIGEGFSKTRASEIANETLETDLRPMDSDDLGLLLPSREISFDSIAAPAGLAMLSWQ